MNILIKVHSILMKDSEKGSDVFLQKRIIQLNYVYFVTFLYEKCLNDLRNVIWLYSAYVKNCDMPNYSLLYVYVLIMNK